MGAMTLHRMAEGHLLPVLRADEVIATSDENLVVRVKEITNRKLAYAAVDPIAGEFTKDMAAAVRPGGTVYVSCLAERKSSILRIIMESMCWTKSMVEFLCKGSRTTQILHDPALHYHRFARKTCCT